MQRFDRSTEPPPSLLRGEVAARVRQEFLHFMRTGSEKRSQTNVPRASWSLNDPGMQTALGRLFCRRCAFCEAEVDTSPFLFRPVAEARPASAPESAHLYYAWLETAWENIYSICTSCRPTDLGYFPVIGARTEIPSLEAINRFVDENLGLWRRYPIPEKAVLLDPCADDGFYRSLWPQSDGVLFGLSRRGDATIENFNLNAIERVAGRRRRYEEYFFRLREGLTDSSPIERVAALFEFHALEFGGTWYLLLRRLALLMGAGIGSKPVVSPSRISRFYLAMSGKPETAERLDRGWRLLAQEDHAHGAVLSGRAKRPGKARISRVHLRNFKAIEDLAIDMPNPPEGEALFDIERPVPSLLILGENSAGKSSILEAVALALSDVAARQKLALDAGEFVLNPSYLGATDADAVRQAEVEISFTNGASRKLAIEFGRMVERGSVEPETVPVFAYGAFRQYQHKQRPRSPDKYIRNLFDGSVLSNPERWLLGLKPDTYAMVMRALREILSIEGEFEVVRRDQEQQRCYMVMAVPGVGGETSFSRTPLSAVSSGFRSVLAMACDVMQGLMDPQVYAGFETLSSARGIVLIDEVEAHLHPRWKMQIMRGLRRALPQMTFIATTHDPLCLRGMDDGEVVVLQRVAAKEHQSATDLPVFVERVLDLPQVSQLRVEQLLTSDLFQLHSTDAPEIEIKLAQIGDLLAKDPLRLDPAEGAAVEKFRRDIADALPIGASEAHRMVQEAVAEYLTQRRAASEKRMKELRQEAKARIIEALQGI